MGFSLSLAAMFAVLASGQTAAAQARKPRKHHGPHLAVVVEGGGLAMASQVRRLIADDAGIVVESLEAYVSRGQRPDLLVTVTVSRARDIHSRARDIQVMYWDRLGVADSLDAPVPTGISPAIIAGSLSAALVRRNLPALSAALRADPRYPHYTGRGRARSQLSSLSPDQLRLFLSRLADRSPRSDRLTVADF